MNINSSKKVVLMLKCKHYLLPRKILWICVIQWVSLQEIFVWLQLWFKGSFKHVLAEQLEPNKTRLHVEDGCEQIIISFIILL